MGDFKSLKGIEGRLYRGISHPMAVTLARAVGVGPFQQVAIAALQAKIADDDVCDFLASSLKKILDRRRELVGYMPAAWEKQEQLGALIEIVGGIGVSALEMADHVMHDYDALLTPDVGRSTDSVTLSPRVAVLYAYGIRTDDFFENGVVRFFSGTTTTHPHLALLGTAAKGHQVGGAAFERLKVWYEKNEEPKVHATVDEVKRRVDRDEERLLRGVAPVEKIVPLPPFDESIPDLSLDAAADRLRAEGVAV